MIKLLARIGRFNTIVIITIVATVASMVVTGIVASFLNSHGSDIALKPAIVFAAVVPMIVAPPICWYLVNLIWRMVLAEEELRNPASNDALTGLLSRHAFFSNAVGIMQHVEHAGVDVFLNRQFSHFWR